MFRIKTSKLPFRVFSAPKLVSVESLYSVTVPNSLLIARVKVAGWGALQVQISSERSTWSEKLRFFGGSREYEIVAPVNSAMIFHVGNLFGMKQFKYIAKPSLDQYPETQPLLSQEMVGLDDLTGSIRHDLSALPKAEIQLNSSPLYFELTHDVLKPQMMRFNIELTKGDTEPQINSSAIKVMLEEFQVPLLDRQKMGRQMDVESELAIMPRALRL
ncbi:hypothetical protein ICN19_00340 [Polynucleobacter sp. AP-Capit-er-40B-B4]|uniref:hypothetical protein n=1 Tax=Polynucleobacter sp. AP-Capit-er-40B-B4 TaxID=2576927 RepID=UPI001C0CD4D5|nr:hypothetical protein [Polynucleobacter sp. AP-Capit-er-40B-B4]MBU3580458.1 hypothetical protein [Polynucleobacter sp. AP-Capit-er-40B-B4]